MTLRKLTAAAVFTMVAGLALPPAAEAGHHHSRSCGHRYSHGGHRSSYRAAPHYGYDSYRYDSYRNDGYRYGYYDAYPYSGAYYRPYGYARPYRYPAPVYRYRSRPHVSIHLDF